jgi:hypothetical protein
VLSDQNAGLFWTTIKGLVDAEFKALQDRARSAAFGF